MAEGEHVRLARMSIEAFVMGRELPDEFEASEELRLERAGAFVSIRRQGTLRGCIGTMEPTAPNLAIEIIRNAVHAATRDPRFVPVAPDELPQLEISVDVLHPSEEVPDASYLDPSKYGVIVECGTRKGLLLPALEGVETAEDQVGIACSKGCIMLHEPYVLRRFKVDRYT